MCHHLAMLEIATITVDAADQALAGFWGALLEWDYGAVGDGDFWVRDPRRDHRPTPRSALLPWH